MNIIREIKEFYKQIRELNASIPTLLDSHTKLNTTLSDISQQKKSHPIPGIRFTSNELYSTLAMFDEDMEVFVKDAIAYMRNDIQQCIIMYDSLLYKSISDIDNYVELVRHIKMLERLKAFIVQYFTGDTDTIFRLYFTNTQIFWDSVKTLPTVDMSMVYVLNDHHLSIDRSVKYIAVEMTQSENLIMSNINTLRMTTKYRKTIIRVLYSIYRGKFFLYHLDTTPRRDY